METLNPKSQNNQINSQKDYEEYLDKQIALGEEDVKKNKTYSYDKIRTQIIENNFKK